MAKATIKSKTGAVITIEGSQDEVLGILSSYEQAASVDQAPEPSRSTAAKKSKPKKQETAPDLIAGLKEGGFFQKPKTITEIVAALEEQGYLYAVTSLSGTLLNLVKRGQLRRKKVEGRWVYGK